MSGAKETMPNLSDAYFSLECDQAIWELISWRTAFERLYRRHASIAAAKNSLSLSLGCASSFHFASGVICWISSEDQLHKFDAYRKSGQKQSYDIRTVLDQRFINWQHNTKLLSNAGDVAVIVTETARREVWLMGLKSVETSNACSLISERRLRSGNKLFVRQDIAHMVVGYHCPPSSGHDEATWIIETMRISSSLGSDQHTTWNTYRLYPSFGANIGQDVAFALYEGYFYAVSTRLATKLVDGDWTSFYDCFWIAVDASKHQMWEFGQIHRRQSNEGPIHDAWTSLQLLPNRTTGELMIVETRREWLNRSSHSVRSCYVQSLGRLPVPCSRAGFRSGPSSWVHHDCDSQMLRCTSLLYKGYNLAASSFLDIGIEDNYLCLRASCSSNQTFSRQESLQAGYISRSRNEECLFVSKTTHSLLLPGTQQGHDSHSCSRNDSENFLAVADDRVVVFLSGCGDSKFKHLILIDFDPQPWSNVS